MSAPLLLPCSPPAHLRSSPSDRGTSVNRTPPLLHIGNFGAYNACQNTPSSKTPLLKNCWQATPTNPVVTPSQILQNVSTVTPSETVLHIPTKQSSFTETNTSAVIYCREVSPTSSRCLLLPPTSTAGDCSPTLISEYRYQSQDISPSRKAFLPSKVFPLKGYSSDSISSLSPLSPLAPNSPTFPRRLPFADDSSSLQRSSSRPSLLKKSQSALIMPSLLTFFRSDSTSASHSVDLHMSRDISTRSLNEPSLPSPLMRKCHTMISLSGTPSPTTQTPNATVTKLAPKEKKRFTFLRRISPSKSAGFNSSNVSSTSSLPNQAQPQPSSIPKSPSASYMLHKYQRTSGSSMWPHLEEHPEETKPSDFNLSSSNVTAVLEDCDDELNYGGTNTVGSCSRCASAGSLTSKSQSAVFNDGVFCKLCLTDVSIRETYQLQQCQCRFCTYCMCMYATLKIREGEPYIDCPDSNCDCSGELTLEEVESLVGPQLLSLHLKFRNDREVDLDPLKTWCPRPGCNTVVSLVSQLDGKPQCCSCPTCNTCFCATCSYSWHPGKPCHKTAGQIDVPLSETIKRCPRCKVPIERDAGCAQMQCKKCKHVFCWYCLASLEDDFLLRHYDKGPCKNKLGHSRASVLLHRAQVVVIFAGFGLLLVIASPILLFVGPCLLCRSCRACTKGDSQDDDSSTV